MSENARARPVAEAVPAGQTHLPTLEHMPNDPIDTRSGARSTRLGLVGLGMVIGAIVTLILVFAMKVM